MTGSVLALVIAGLDGGEPLSSYVPDRHETLYSTCPDAPPTIDLDGGWKLMPPERSARLRCLLVTCETSRKLAENDQRSAPPWWWAVTIGAVAAAATLAWWLRGLAP